MKRYFYLTLILMFPLLLFGQENYYMSDTTTSVGKNLIDQGIYLNQKLCSIKSKTGITEFKPTEVQEYGFKDGRIYVSKPISYGDSVKQFFILRLVTGNTNLFLFYDKKGKRFFLNRDNSPLLEIPSFPNKKLEHFRNFLSDFTSDCQEVHEASRLVSRNVKSFSKFIRQYNTCDNRYFPHFRYGVLLGLELTKLISLSSYDNVFFRRFNFNYDPGYSLGAFIDGPIMVSDFSVHLEAAFSIHHFLFNYNENNTDYDFSGDLSAIQVPLLIRYTIPAKKVRPFINAGIVETINLKNDYSIYSATIGESVIEIDKVNELSRFDDYHFGYCAGAGIELKRNYRQSLFFELRISKLHGISGSKTVNLSNINFTTGINF